MAFSQRVPFILISVSNYPLSTVKLPRPIAYFIISLANQLLF
ncbi:hypothetical protein QWZ13_04135 [Reinekea marina]|nr:hypothetical protein [Reinekea marina]MDN3648092.1 hypothetical protein [Reinekea marina]